MNIVTSVQSPTTLELPIGNSIIAGSTTAKAFPMVLPPLKPAAEPPAPSKILTEEISDEGNHRLETPDDYMHGFLSQLGFDAPFNNPPATSPAQTSALTGQRPARADTAAVVPAPTKASTEPRSPTTLPVPADIHLLGQIRPVPSTARTSEVRPTSKIVSDRAAILDAAANVAEAEKLASSSEHTAISVNVKMQRNPQTQIVPNAMMQNTPSEITAAENQPHKRLAAAPVKIGSIQNIRLPKATTDEIVKKPVEQEGTTSRIRRASKAQGKMDIDATASSTQNTQRGTPSNLTNLVISGPAQPNIVTHGNNLGIVTITGIDEAQAAMARSLDMARGDIWLNELAKDIVAARQSEARLNFSLSPENLGRLDVDIANDEKGVSLKMTTGNEEAARLINNAQSKLTDELRSHGVRVSGAEILTRNESQDSTQQDSQYSPAKPPMPAHEIGVQFKDSDQEPTIVARPQDRFA